MNAKWKRAIVWTLGSLGAMGILSVLFCVALMGIIWLARPRLEPLPAVPAVNGYDDFIKAAAALDPRFSYWDWESRAPDGLKELVEGNTAAYELIQTGLSKKCRVPVQPGTAFIEQQFSYLAQLKSLAFLLEARGRLSELEGRTNDAVRVYLEAVRFGQESARGGLVIHAIVGIAVEAIAGSPLEEIAGSLGVEESRAMVQSLLEIEIRSQSAQEFVNQDRRWARTLGNWPYLQNTLQEMIMSRSLNPRTEAHRKFLSKYSHSERRRRTLMLRCAARLYELEQGHPPATSRDLVPAYLRDVPKDPVSGEAMKLPANGRFPAAEGNSPSAP